MVLCFFLILWRWSFLWTTGIVEWPNKFSCGHMGIHWPVCALVHLSIRLFAYPSVCLFICPTIHTVFSGSVHYFSLIFGTKLVMINKHIKVVGPIFEQNWVWNGSKQKWGKGGIFGPKINAFALFPKSVLKALKSGWNWWLYMFKENFYKIGYIGHIWPQDHFFSLFF